MAQMSIGEGGSARPADLSEAQIESIVAGAGIEGSLEVHSGPSDLDDEDIKTLARGKEIDPDKLREVRVDLESRAGPGDLNDEEIEALAAGKEIDPRRLEEVRVPVDLEELDVPPDLTAAEVKAAGEGKEIDLEKRGKKRKSRGA